MAFQAEGSKPGHSEVVGDFQAAAMWSEVPKFGPTRIWRKRSADFPVGKALNSKRALELFRGPAGWKARETADKNVCATGIWVAPAGPPVLWNREFRIGCSPRLRDRQVHKCRPARPRQPLWDARVWSLEAWIFLGF